MILPFKDYFLTRDINTSYELMTICMTKDCSFCQYFFIFLLCIHLNILTNLIFIYSPSPPNRVYGWFT